MSAPGPVDKVHERRILADQRPILPSEPAVQRDEPGTVGIRQIWTCIGQLRMAACAPSIRFTIEFAHNTGESKSWCGPPLRPGRCSSTISANSAHYRSLGLVNAGPGPVSGGALFCFFSRLRRGLGFQFHLNHFETLVAQILGQMRSPLRPLDRAGFSHNVLGFPVRHRKFRMRVV